MPQYLDPYYFPEKSHGRTDAMKYIKRYHKVPPVELAHDPNIQDYRGNTVAHMLAINFIQVPPMWYCKPDIQNCFGFTIAMILAYHGQEIGRQWNHRTDLRDANYNTVAMILGTQNGLKVPSDWYHDPDLKTFYGDTVQSLFLRRHIDLSEEWNCSDNHVDSSRRSIYQLKQQLSEKKELSEISELKIILQ